MKYLFILVIFFSSCDSQKKVSEQQTKLCGEELTNYLESNLVTLRKGKFATSTTIFKKTKSFPSMLKSTYANCLIGMDKEKILEFFGGTYLEGNRLVYMVSDKEDFSNALPLDFVLDESNKAVSVMYLGRSILESMYASENELKKCEDEFKTFLSNNLEYISNSGKRRFIIFKRNDSVFNTIEKKYASCLVGKTKFEVLDLFGNAVSVLNDVVQYNVAESNPDKNADQYLLNFTISEEGLVSKVSYDKVLPSRH